MANTIRLKNLPEALHVQLTDLLNDAKGHGEAGCSDADVFKVELGLTRERLPASCRAERLALAAINEPVLMISESTGQRAMTRCNDTS